MAEPTLGQQLWAKLLYARLEGVTKDEAIQICDDFIAQVQRQQIEKDAQIVRNAAAKWQRGIQGHWDEKVVARLIEMRANEIIHQWDTPVFTEYPDPVSL